MKRWVRTLMIVTGIMLMLILVIYTDPNSIKEIISQKYKPGRSLRH
jgi:hypothetical protein